MPPGPKPKPIEQRREEGTFRADRHAKTPIVSGPRVRPKCPPELTGPARKIFARLVRELWPARILDQADASLVATAAMHLAIAYDAQERIAQLGSTYPVTRGAYNGSPGFRVLEANPAVAIMRNSLAEYRQCCDALGIGPAARARLANMGVKGAGLAQALPGVGDGPTPLRLIEGGAPSWPEPEPALEEPAAEPEPDPEPEPAEDDPDREPVPPEDDPDVEPGTWTDVWGKP
jgi:P27 family predicted phage terminase small subunit